MSIRIHLLLDFFSEKLRESLARELETRHVSLLAGDLKRDLPESKYSRIIYFTVNNMFHENISFDVTKKLDGSNRICFLLTNKV